MRKLSLRLTSPEQPSLTDSHGVLSFVKIYRLSHQLGDELRGVTAPGRYALMVMAIIVVLAKSLGLDIAVFPDDQAPPETL